MNQLFFLSSVEHEFLIPRCFKTELLTVNDWLNQCHAMSSMHMHCGV